MSYLQRRNSAKPLTAYLVGRPLGKTAPPPPPEVLKSGKSALQQHLSELLCLCWKKGYISQDMRNANIVTAYKNKGHRNDMQQLPWDLSQH
jgi:hypothetical protein